MWPIDNLHTQSKDSTLYTAVSWTDFVLLIVYTRICIDHSIIIKFV